MSPWLGIALIVLAVILFFISYFLNEHTPVPKGTTVRNEEDTDNACCSGCKNTVCSRYRERKD